MTRVHHGLGLVKGTKSAPKAFLKIKYRQLLTSMGFTAFLADHIDHARLLVLAAKASFRLATVVEARPLATPRSLAATVDHIDHPRQHVTGAKTTFALTLKVEAGLLYTVRCFALCPHLDADHAVELVGETKPKSLHTFEVVGGLCGASGRLTQLLLHIDHVLIPVTNRGRKGVRERECVCVCIRERE